MLSIPGYEIQEKIHEGTRTLIFRGLRKADDKHLIIKILKEEQPSLEEISRFKREYEINQIAEGAGLGKAYSLEKTGSSYAMMLEDIGARSLDQILASRKFTLKEVLDIAIQISDQLLVIHEKPIIHKDINPSNIIWNAETNQARLIDFGISSLLPREKQGIINPNLLEGTLAYISPEQTGRMNRGTDERSDYYSLGVTLYQILTGVLPFNSNDPMELIHLQIAKLPVPPSEINPEIPQVLSNIVLKLMSKPPEDRYQGARGLQHDLTQCLNALNQSGKVDLFPLGSHDISDRFEISGKIYDRKEELARLLQMFESSSRGKANLLLVSGSSGIGKTSLVLEIHKPLVQKRGIFIAGKCEQFKQDVPYGGIIQALDDWVRQMLVEEASILEGWRKTLLDSLGSNGGLVTDLVPSFEKILGPQPKPPELGPSEAHERFNWVFIKFFQTLATQEHPLVIFLDDLQWANLSTLNLIKAVLLNGDSRYLFLIGAYRSNEPSSESITRFVTDDLKKSGFIAEILNLAPIPFDDLWLMLSDTLQTLPDRVKSLAELCYTRSGGNPFFYIQLIKYLHQKKLIHIDASHERWEWDLEQIKKEGVTEKIAELMSIKIQKLKPTTQEVIKLAACIGFNFDLQTLANIYNKTVQETFKDLWETLLEELVLPEDESYKYILQEESQQNGNVRFRFVHDRIQQCAYGLLSKEQQEKFHYQIGEFLFKETAPEKLPEKVFQIVDHFILAKPLLTGEEGRLLLIKLALLAGKRAKSSSAFKTAVYYLDYAKELLKEDSWAREYDLSLDILKNLCECLYNSGSIQPAYQLVQLILGNVKTDIEKAEIYRMQGIQLTAIGMLSEAIDSGINGLRLFQIKIKKHPSKLTLLKELILARLYLGRRPILSLLDMPRMTSAQHILMIKLMNMIRIPAYVSGNFDLMGLMGLKSANFSMRHGNNEESAIAYSSLGVILRSNFGDQKNGADFIKLGIELNEKFKDIANQPYLYFVYGLFGLPFEKHWKLLREYLDKAIEIGLRVGDVVWTSLSCVHVLIWDPEMPREVMLEEAKKYEKLIDPKRFWIPWNTFMIGQVFHANLAGKTNDRFSMSLPHFDEFRAVEELKKVHMNSPVAAYYMRKAVIYYMYNKPQEASQAIAQMKDIVSALYGTPSYTDYCLYTFLIQIAQFDQLPWYRKIPTYFALKKPLRNMKKWAAFCPVNFIHKYLLMKAELANLQGKSRKAAKLYQKAIAESKKCEFLNIEALATELAAKFFLSRNEEAVARTLMRESYYAYYKYGAVTKLKVMAETYPDLIIEVATPTPASSTPTTTIHATQSTVSTTWAQGLHKSLDFNTFVKASEAISSEIVLEKLIKKMMLIIIENAGAQKGWLILQKEGHWIVEAEGSIEDVNLISQPIDTLPKSLINSVINSKNPLVFSNPAWLGQFASDAYIQKVHPKAVLCMPLLNHGELRGVLYLENNLTKDAFTSDRLELLNLLGSQIAISIDNATLYNDSISLNKKLEVLNKSLSRFIPREFLAILGKSSITDVKIGDSIQKEMTILFTDIRNFTARSEKMSPEENFQFVNGFLKVMAPIIRSHDGFIDKYLGDGFMAIFPTDTDTALQAAINMLRNLNDYNAKNFPDSNDSLKIGIGCNTGRVMLGTVGEEERLEETVISDAVNTASRLQGETKIYGTPLLISSETYEKLKNKEHHDIREIDRILLRGKSELSTIYEVFENDLPKVVLLKRQTKEDFEKAIALYYQKHEDEALIIFNQIIQLNPDDAPAQYWCNRIKIRS